MRVMGILRQLTLSGSSTIHPEPSWLGFLGGSDNFETSAIDFLVSLVANDVCLADQLLLSGHGFSVRRQLLRIDRTAFCQRMQNWRRGDRGHDRHNHHHGK